MQPRKHEATKSTRKRKLFFVLSCFRGKRRRYPASCTTFFAASSISSAVVKIHLALFQQPFAFIDVRAFHADDDRHRHAQFRDRGHDALREDVAPQDPAEDVDEHGLDVLVGHQDLERVADLLGAGAAAHVQEVGRLPPPA